MVGIVLGTAWPQGATAAWIVLAGCAAILVRSILSRQDALWSPVVFCAAVGCICIQPWMAAHIPSNHVSRFANQGKFRIQGLVDTQPEADGGRVRFELRTLELSRGQEKHVACGLLQVTARGRPSAPRVGDLVSLEAHVRPIDNFGNPGAFDFKRFMSFQGILCRAFTSQPLQIDRSPLSGAGQDFFETWRTGLARQMDTALPQRGPLAVGVLKALILGDRSQVTPELREEFNRAGASHLLAISGLHVGIVAFFSFAVFVRLLSFLPWALDHAWTRKGASLLTLGPVVLYGLLAGMSPSTQRAILMTTVFLATFWIGRRHDWFNTLAAAALLILLAFPPALLSISFQLSFTAVAAILTGARLLERVFARPEAGIGRRILHYLASLFWVSILATAGTLPLVLYHFNQVSLAGPVVNLVVVPLTATLAVPFGLLGVACAGLAPFLAGVFWQVAALSVEAVVWIVAQAARWPFAAVETVTPSVLEVLLLYALMLLLINWRRTNLHWGLAGLLLAAGGGDAAYWLNRRFGREHLSVTAIDVGQGSANLLQLPGGYVVLVDGGGFNDPSSFDVGRQILGPFLRRQKIMTVDLVVLSHANLDHYGGLLYILHHFNTREVWSNHEPSDSKAFRLWLDLIDLNGIRHIGYRALPKRAVRHATRFDILAPPADFDERGAIESWREVNNNSLVMKVSFGKVSFLFPGDIGRAAEYDLLKRLPDGLLRSTVLMVPHHGSRKSCSNGFLKAVRPEQAVISAGRRNRFKFPHKPVLARLKAYGAKVWRTDRHGAVAVDTDGEHYRVISFSADHR